LSNDLSQEIAPICKKVKGADFGMDTPLSPTNSETGESLFELYLAVQEFIRFVSEHEIISFFYSFISLLVINYDSSTVENFKLKTNIVIRYREHLNASDYQGLSTQCYYHWFEPALEKWLDLAKLKIVQRAKKALELSTICQGEMIVKHSTSSNDVVTALCHVSKIDQNYTKMSLLETVCEVDIFTILFISYRVYADEGILETPRLAGPDPVVQFRTEIIRRNVVCSFNYSIIIHTKHEIQN